MQPVKISVIVCTWNSARYLQCTLDSIAGQSYKNFEVIFVDGGSMDETLRIIENSRFEKRILNNIRGGIARAMNAGIELASGGGIFHLHSDDYIVHGDVFETVCREFAETGAKWIFGRIVNRRERALYSETYVAPKHSYEALLKANYIPHAATFVQKHVFQELGYFDENLRFAMDYDMWLRISSRYQPRQLSEIFSVFRRHPGSTTEGNRLASFSEDYTVRRKHIGRSPIRQLEHYLRYILRRRRLLKLVRVPAN